MGRPDASVGGGYERADSGFSKEALNAAGNLRPIRQTFNYATFGLNINLPLFNRNQGAVAADTAAIQAARSRIAAEDLSLRHEVAQNLIRFNRPQARATGYRSGLRDPAAHNLDLAPQPYSSPRHPLPEVI